MRSFDRKTIDQVLNDDTDYTVVYTRGLDASCCEQCPPAPSDNSDATEYAFIGHGITGVLEAMAQVLVILDYYDLGTPSIAAAQLELRETIREHDAMPQDLKDVQSEIDELTKTIEEAPDRDAKEIQQAVGLRRRLGQSTSVLRDLISSRDDLIGLAQNRVKLATAIALIVDQAKIGELDVNAPMVEDVLKLAWVPEEEPRRTIGALVYYYVERLADTETSRVVIEQR